MEYTDNEQDYVTIEYSTTLLHLAVSCGDTRIMEYFIELGANLNATTYEDDTNGLSSEVAPLHKAVKKGVSPIFIFC